MLRALPIPARGSPCPVQSPLGSRSHGSVPRSDPELFAVGMRQITRGGALDDSSAASSGRQPSRRGPQNFSVSVVSDSGSTFNLTLRIEAGVAMVGKQNPDGSVTRFRGPAPDKEGLMRLEGIDARNAGAYLSGVIPAYAKGRQFTLEVCRRAPPPTARAPRLASWRTYADRGARARAYRRIASQTATTIGLQRTSEVRGVSSSHDSHTILSNNTLAEK